MALNDERSTSMQRVDYTTDPWTATPLMRRTSSKIPMINRSPYADTTIVKFYVGPEKTEFGIHKSILCQSAALSALSSPWTAADQGLPDLDENVAHILFHYLYTGTYSPFKSISFTSTAATAAAQDENAALESYTLATRAYTTAIRYSLAPLAELARAEIRKLTPGLGIEALLTVARDHAFPHLPSASPSSSSTPTTPTPVAETPESESWYEPYLRGVILDALHADADAFRGPEIISLVAGCRRLVRLLWTTVLGTLSPVATPKRGGTPDSGSVLVGAGGQRAGTSTGVHPLANETVCVDEDGDEDVSVMTPKSAKHARADSVVMAQDTVVLNGHDIHDVDKAVLSSTNGTHSTTTATATAANGTTSSPPTCPTPPFKPSKPERSPSPSPLTSKSKPAPNPPPPTPAHEPDNPTTTSHQSTTTATMVPSEFASPLVSPSPSPSPAPAAAPAVGNGVKKTSKKKKKAKLVNVSSGGTGGNAVQTPPTVPVAAGAGVLGVGV